MAEKVGGAAEKKRPPKTHNVADLTKKLEPFVKDIVKAYDAMEEDHGSHVLTINNKFDKIAEATGFPKSLIRTHIAGIRRSIKAEKSLKEMTEDDLSQEIELLKGFEGTAFGKHIEGRIAKLQAALAALT